MSFPPSGIPQKPRKVDLLHNSRKDECITTAGQAIYPGMLVTKIAAGTLSKHSVLGDFAQAIFATEEGLYSLNAPGSTPNSIDTVYADGALASLLVSQKGDHVNALLKAGVNYQVGDYLISAGDGTLMKRTSASTTTLVKQIVAKISSTGAVNLSATGAVNTRASVEIV